MSARALFLRAGIVALLAAVVFLAVMEHRFYQGPEPGGARFRC